MEVADGFCAPKARFGLRWRQPPLFEHDKSGGVAAALQSVAFGDAKRE
jgi:hypothetical protein